MNETLKYKLLTTIRYFGDAFFYPFFALYLKSINLIESEIGFILSISPIISIICNPFYSYLCKDINKTKKVLGIITIIEGIVILTISFSNNFILISCLTLFLALSGSCHYGLLDSITSFYSVNNNINYSSIRVFGSIAYIIATIIGGYLSSSNGYRICFIVSTILFISCSFLYFIILPFDYKEIKENKVSVIKTLKYLFSNKNYIVFIIIYSLIMATQSSTDSFFSLYLESRNISSNTYGIVYAYFVLFEVITLSILNKKKIDILKNSYFYILIASFLLAIRMLFNFLNVNIYIVIILSALRGIGYALILNFSFSYVQLIVKKDAASIAIMVMTLLYSSFLAILNNINGILINNYSYSIFYLLQFIIAIIAIVICLLRMLLNKKQNN